MKRSLLVFFALSTQILSAETPKIHGTSCFESLETRAGGKNYRFSISGAAAQKLYEELKIEAKYDQHSQDQFIRNKNLVVYTKFARLLVCSHIYNNSSLEHSFTCWINVDEQAELFMPIALSVTKVLGEGRSFVKWSEKFSCYVFYLDGPAAHAFYDAMNVGARFDPDTTTLWGKTIKSYTKWGPQFACDYDVFEDGSPSHFSCWTHAYTNGTIAHFK